MKRFASAIWHGGLKNGMGIISTESGVLKQTPFTFGARFQGMLGTNPEEMLAAAHAGSFSLTLAAELDKAGLAADAIRTAAVLSIEELDGGWTVTQIHLDVIVRVADADEAKLEAAANAAKAGCPVSRLFNTKITLSTKLDSSKGFEKKAVGKSASTSAKKRVGALDSQKEFEHLTPSNSPH